MSDHSPQWRPLHSHLITSRKSPKSLKRKVFSKLISYRGKTRWDPRSVERESQLNDRHTHINAYWIKLIIMIMIDDRNDNALGMRRETRRMNRVFSLQFFGAYTLPLAVGVRPRARKRRNKRKTNTQSSHTRMRRKYDEKNGNENENETRGKGSLSN